MWDAGRTQRRGSRLATAVILVTLLAAIVVQVSIVTRLGLPLGRPDLVVILLGCVALERGPAFGAVVGFVIGLVADLASSHAVGQSAVVLVLVGYGVGMVGAGWVSGPEGSALAPFAVLAGASALGTLADVALAAILGDVSMTGGQALTRALAAALYALVLSPLVVPLVHGGLRRLDGERR